MQYQKDLSSEHKDLFPEVRKVLLGIAFVREIRKDKITTYTVRGACLCHIRTMPHGVDTGFLKRAFYA